MIKYQEEKLCYIYNARSNFQPETIREVSELERIYDFNQMTLYNKQ